MIFRKKPNLLFRTFIIFQWKSVYPTLNRFLGLVERKVIKAFLDVEIISRVSIRYEILDLFENIKVLF